MYHCFWLVAAASAMALGARSEPREEKIDDLVEDEVTAPEVERKDERGDEHDDGRPDDFGTRRPRDLLHLGGHLAPEIARGDPPLLRLVDDIHNACFHGFFLYRDWLAGQE